MFASPTIARAGHSRSEPARALFQSRITAWSLIVAWGMLGLTVVNAAGIPNIKERALKTGFLLNFAKFTQFPGGKFAKSTDPILFAVSGDKIDEAILNKILQQKKPVLKKRKFSLTRATSDAGAKAVHILFLPNDTQLTQMASARGSGVLTVGNSDAFWAAGGIIQFVEKGGKVRFRVNLKRAKEEKIKISSQLLRLAVEVKK